MIISEIPLTPSSQTLQCTIGGVKYTLTVLWRGNGYFLDISDSLGNTIVSGLALVTGCNLLGQLVYLGLPGALYIISDVDPAIDALFTTLGVSSHLCMVS